jgi:hypothetical protein
MKMTYFYSQTTQRSLLALLLIIFTMHGIKAQEKDRTPIQKP